MTPQDTMRLALEALKLPSMKTEKMLMQRDEAIEALKAALSQQGEQPVAWVWNPASIAWEKVRAFGHWQQGAVYAFGPTQPEPLYAGAAPAAQPIIQNYLEKDKTQRDCSTCKNFDEGSYGEACITCGMYYADHWEAKE